MVLSVGNTNGSTEFRNPPWSKNHVEAATVTKVENEVNDRREPGDSDDSSQSSGDSGFDDFLAFLSSPSGTTPAPEKKEKKVVDNVAPLVKAVPAPAPVEKKVVKKKQQQKPAPAVAAKAKKAEPTFIEALSPDAPPAKAAEPVKKEEPKPAVVKKVEPVKKAVVPTPKPVKAEPVKAAVPVAVSKPVVKAAPVEPAPVETKKVEESAPAEEKIEELVEQQPVATSRPTLASTKSKADLAADAAIASVNLHDEAPIAIEYFTKMAAAEKARNTI